MQTTITPKIIVGILFAVGAPAQDDTPVEVKLRIPLNSSRLDRREGPRLEVSLQHVPLSGEPLRMDGSGNGQPILGRLAQMLRASRDQDLPRFLEVWAPDERPQVELNQKDDRVRRNDQSYMKSVTEFRPLSIIYLGRYRLVVVAHRFIDKDIRPMIYPFVEERGQFWMTNDLKGDPIFYFAMTSLGKQFTDEFVRKNPALAK